VKICRFISPTDVSRDFGEQSSFCLTNYDYFKSIEKNSSIGDDKEGIIDAEKEGRWVCATRVKALLSCWTILENGKISEENWDIFPEKRGIAVISSTEKMKAFFERSLAACLQKEWFYFEERQIKYYPEGEGPGESFSAQRNGVRAYFYKRNCFINQREYRFAFRLPQKYSFLKLLVFYVEPSKYIEEIVLYPRLEKAERQQITKRLLDAEIISKVANL